MIHCWYYSVLHLDAHFENVGIFVIVIESAAVRFIIYTLLWINAEMYVLKSMPFDLWTFFPIDRALLPIHLFNFCAKATNDSLDVSDVHMCNGFIFSLMGNAMKSLILFFRKKIDQVWSTESANTWRWLYSGYICTQFNYTLR